MNDPTDIYPLRERGPVTFAEGSSDTPLADIFRTAERSSRLTGNIVSESASREEAYDNRIRAIKTATGIELENPERGGYSRDARHAIRQEVIAGGMSPIDETGGIPAYQKRIFDQKVAELQVKHPELTDTITGNVGEEARTLAAGSSRDLARAMDQPGSPVLKFGAEFAGGAWGSRRDPIFLGSLFAGPTTAVGKTALARVASSALNQGLFNAGITAMEQPTVQDWHKRIGQESGVVPALQDVGMAFLLGMIPGAGIEGLKEAATPLRRLLAGRPEPGDVARASEHLGPVEPSAAAAMRAGEDSLAADRAVLTEPAPKDMPPELHDDLMGAALKRADDPSAASPEAVAAVAALEPERVQSHAVVVDGKTYTADTHLEAYNAALRENGGIDPGGGRRNLFMTTRGRLIYEAGALELSRAVLGLVISPELQDRIRQATPQTEREAHAAADEALDDFGRRDGMSALRESVDRAKVDEADAARPVAFTTAKGSTYEVHEDGTTTRTKAARADLGHEGDSGLKPRSARTVYVDDARVFNPPDSAKWRVVDHGNGTMSLAVQNADGKWGISPESRNIKFQTEPKIGLQPLELWKPDTVNGLQAYRGVHPGNAITEMGPRYARGDPFGKIPFVGEDGKATMLTAKSAAALGERETTAAMLVRSCV